MMIIKLAKKLMQDMRITKNGIKKPSEANPKVCSRESVTLSLAAMMRTERLGQINLKMPLAKVKPQFSMVCLVTVKVRNPLART